MKTIAYILSLIAGYIIWQILESYIGIGGLVVGAIVAFMLQPFLNAMFGARTESPGQSQKSPPIAGQYPSKPAETLEAEKTASTVQGAPVSQELLVNGLKNYLRQVRSYQPITKQLSAVTYLARELRTSPYWIVEGLIKLSKTSVTGKQLASQARLTQQLALYEDLFASLPDSQAILAGIEQTDKVPLFTWIATHEVASTFSREYLADEEFRKMTMKAFAVGEDIQLAEAMRNTPGISLSVIQDLIGRIKKRGSQFRNIGFGAAAACIFISLALFIYENIGIFTSPQTWRFSYDLCGAHVFLWLMGLMAFLFGFIGRKMLATLNEKFGMYSGS